MSLKQRLTKLYLKLGRKKEIPFVVTFDEEENKYHDGKKYPPEEWDKYLEGIRKTSEIKVRIYLPALKEAENIVDLPNG